MNKFFRILIVLLSVLSILMLPGCGGNVAETTAEATDGADQSIL